MSEPGRGVGIVQIKVAIGAAIKLRQKHEIVKIRNTGVLRLMPRGALSGTGRSTLVKIAGKTNTKTYGKVNIQAVMGLFKGCGSIIAFNRR